MEAVGSRRPVDLVGLAPELLQRVAVVPSDHQPLGNAGKHAQFDAHPCEVRLEEPGWELGGPDVVRHEDDNMGKRRGKTP
jgi:hypothetical protein